MIKVIKNFLKYREFLATVVKRDITKKYHKSYLGILWSVLRPLLTASVMWIAFNTLFERKLPNFIIYLLCGFLIIHFHDDATSSALHSIMKNSTIIRKIYIPKYMFVVSDVMVSIINMAFSLVPLAFFIIITGTKITWLWIFIPFLLIMLFMFSLGISLIVSTYNVFFRDLAHLYGVLLVIGHYLSAVFYPITIIPQEYLFLWRLNPIFHYITLFRAIIYNPSFPDLIPMPTINDIVIACVYSVLTLAMGCVIFNENQEKFFLYM